MARNAPQLVSVPVYDRHVLLGIMRGVPRQARTISWGGRQLQVFVRKAPTFVDRWADVSGAREVSRRKGGGQC